MWTDNVPKISFDTQSLKLKPSLPAKGYKQHNLDCHPVFREVSAASIKSRAGEDAIKMLNSPVIVHVQACGSFY